jgi:Sec-independent protein translocase protein TatA
VAIELWEIIIIAAIVLFIFFRPSTITDVARSTGRAVAEFRGAFRQGADNPSEDLKQLAGSLGIATEGKSAQQLSDEIVAKKDAVSS